MSFKQGICNFCGTGCGNIIEATENSITGVLPDPGHPFNEGKLCVRGWHIHEMLGTEERLSTPLIKKDGSFHETSYAEAIDLAADNLKKYDSSEIAFLGSPRSSNEENYLLTKLARAVFKTNNIGLTSDLGHRNFIDVSLEGTGSPYMAARLRDISSADYILIIGSDITKVNPMIGSEIIKAEQNGAHLVTISSIKTQIANLSTKHIQPHPGSIKACITCMAKAIIEDDEYNKSHIIEKTSGFEGFANFLGSVKYEEIKDIIQTDYTELKEAAVKLVKADKALVIFPSGVSGLDKDTISYIYNLFLLADKIGKPGCGLLPLTAICNIVGSFDMGVTPDLLPGYQPVDDPQVIDTFNKAWNTELNNEPGKNAYDLLSENTGQLKALIVIDHDEEIIHYADKIKELEFIVYLGSFTNPFTELADVILPVATYAETEGTFTNTERNIQYTPQMLKPQHGIMPAIDIYTAIAAKENHNWSYDSPADIMREIADLSVIYNNMDYATIKENYGCHWLAPAETMESITFNFVNFVANLKIPETSEEFPYAMLIGVTNHFWHKNNVMKKTFIPKREYNATLLLYPNGFVEMNNRDAEKIGVRDKWPVKISSKRGSLEVSVRISDDINPGTTYVPYFIHDMAIKSLLDGEQFVRHGEDTFIPVKIEKV